DRALDLLRCLFDAHRSGAIRRLLRRARRGDVVARGGDLLPPLKGEGGDARASGRRRVGFTNQNNAPHPSPRVRAAPPSPFGGGISSIPYRQCTTRARVGGAGE